MIKYQKKKIKRRAKMSEVKWTKEQQDAIYEKGSNILVAAAARKWKNCSISRKNNKQNNK